MPSHHDHESHHSHHSHESEHRRISSTEPKQYAVVEVPADKMEVYEVEEDDDEEPEVHHHSAFHDKSRRMAFVRKTLGTVLLQLVFCAAITAGCLYSPSHVKRWMVEHWYIGFIGAVFWLAINIAVGCCGVGRGPPSCCNISLLVFATICLTFFCAFMTVGFSQDVVLYALASTVLVLLIVVVITVFTPLDITGCGIFLFCAGLVLFIGAIFASIFLAVSDANRETMRIVALCICILCILLLTMYILYDLQLLVGGRKHQLEEDDWLFACLMLFGDIVYLFIQFLQLFGLLPST